MGDVQNTASCGAVSDRLSRNQATLLGVVLNRSRDAAVETYGSGEGTY